MSYIVKVERTQNKFINKFEINKFITNHLSFEYNNIDDAKNSQLAQELFYLPFVKKVYITPCLLYTSPSPRDISGSRMPSSA